MTDRIAFFIYGVLNAEAADRLDQLHLNGSTPSAFTFKQPFDAAGAPARLKRA